MNLKLLIPVILTMFSIQLIAKKTDAYDKAKGIVYLSLFGDSLGLPGEFKFDRPAQYELGTKQKYYSKSAYQNPWAIWLSKKDINDSERGLISDDSYYKLFLLGPYFKNLKVKKANHDDKNFYDFLLDLRTRANTSFKSKPWVNSYKEHLMDWFKMFDESHCETEDKNCYYRIAQTRYPGKRSFYTKKQDICFGVFMHLWQGFALWNTSFREAPLVKYRMSSTKLDNPDATGATALATGLFYDLLSQNPKEGHFLKSLLDASRDNLLKLKQLNTVKIINYQGVGKLNTTFENATEFGLSIREQPIFRARKSIFNRRKNLKIAGITNLRFDPAEFLWTVWVAASYAGKDALKAMKLIANAGGDTDTIASLYGSLWGAYSGYRSTLRWYPNLKNELKSIKSFQDAHSLPIEQLISSLSQSKYEPSIGYKKLMRASILASKVTGSEPFALKKMGDPTLVWVDVRSKQEHSVSKIPGALTQSQYEAAFAINPAEFKNKKIVAYCTVGYRSGKYAASLAKKGIQAFNFVGGISRWTHLEGQLIDSKNQSTKRVHVYGPKWNYLPKHYEGISKPSVD